ncbi:GNAT family N-acetyltransferase [Bifidobacterium sp. BRDM6]|uniref:GNAT family N-acetyltransferase n=1 Tax=Bifidobacterium choloepi TaxID=2614131 RepID=A0A6I5N345_9BIFI|nr:GNAT family N-acetyltransferase [Bifidobacterium choloepi]NEG70079.1 GNAT family N-acetyltransferase [Bifidobacterium choloepi]
MMVIERVTPATMEQKAAEAGIELPIEQTAVWADFQSGIPGRKPWGSLLIRDNANGGDVVAVISLIDMETHGYHYLRSIHGPSWASRPTQEQENDAVQALLKFVRIHDKQVAFLRIDTWHDDDDQYPVLSTVPYSETVVLDLEGGEDGILSRMKSRGRRDVRKALRECPADIADETAQATQDFTDYYHVMVETSQRDGFNPAPMSDYTDMIKALGPDHCRVFAARIDDKVVAWSIVAMHGKTAVYYYASMLSAVRRLHVPDKLLFTVACMLGEQGLEKLDLMGIGNDFAPSLKPLNEFKTKFTKETTAVAAGHDFPIKKTLYRSLVLMKDLRARLRGDAKKDIRVDEKGGTNKDWKEAAGQRPDNNPNRAGKASGADGKGGKDSKENATK